MSTDPYTWFESEWQARVSQISSRRAYELSPLNYNNTTPEWNVPVNHVASMKVEITEPDLMHMIRDLRDAHAHAQVQQRYPQLKEAYMNYLSQVYLTVDKWPS